MELKLTRFFSGTESTLGAFYIDKKPECFTLEDQYQAKKVAGETRIPAGKYPVEKLTADTGLTLKYRKKHPEFFDYHLEIKNIPGFKYVYIHKGNKDDHTEGCLLLGDTLSNNQYDDGFLGASTQAFTRVYKKISDAISIGEKVNITIEDIG